MLPLIELSETDLVTIQQNSMRNAVINNAYRNIFGEDALINSDLEASLSTQDVTGGIRLINHLIGKRKDQNVIKSDIIACTIAGDNGEDIMEYILESFPGNAINDNLGLFTYMQPYHGWVDPKDPPIKPNHVVTVSAKSGAWMHFCSGHHGNANLRAYQRVNRPLVDGVIDYYFATINGSSDTVTTILIWLAQNNGLGLLDDLTGMADSFKGQVHDVKLLNEIQFNFNKQSSYMNSIKVSPLQIPIYSAHLSITGKPNHVDLPEREFDLVMVSLAGFLTEQGGVVEVHPDAELVKEAKVELHGNPEYQHTLWTVAFPERTYVIAVGSNLNLQMLTADGYQFAKMDAISNKRKIWI